MSKQGNPTQYLGICDFFKNQSLSKQKEILKTHKVCHICLSPKASCRKEPDLSICNKQVYFNLKCRQCGDLKNHTAMCPQKTSSYQSEFQPDSQRGRGGGRGDRGGRGRGQRQHNDRRPQNNQGTQNQSFTTQSSHPQPSNSTCSLPNSGSSPSASTASCSFPPNCTESKVRCYII